ncbi:MAG TPA: alternative ribosome rescue aminoacyl-tRNA hydrolase ArfB [Gemmatimonadaceae bacterium]|jgi:ribosome-associated protein|nr:alternative ribosome rescue aminoacyl-tRNA hydrolase ArfB [Gemmatimonadaceae bacterium]
MTDVGHVAPENLLPIDASLSIPRSELDVRVSRSSGAGGQHVNKTSSRVEIFWNIAESRSLTDDQRNRLLTRLASRLTSTGSIRIVASQMRSQSRNRELAEERLAEIVRRALIVAKKRKPTRPTRAAKEARLQSKKRQSRKKSERRKESFD